MISQRSDPWLSATLLVVSVATLGRALQVGDGTLKQGTIPWLAIALAACVAAVLVPLPQGRASYGRSEIITALVAVLVWQILQMLGRLPSNALAAPIEEHARFANGVIGAGLLVGSVLLAGGWVRHAAFMLLLLTHLLLGAWVIRASPAPEIDVFVFQRDASLALLSGVNPYAITFPSIYGDDAPWYGPGLTVEGRLQFGYPYMPLTLLLALPGHVLGGDYRYSLLGAIALSAALIAYARPSIVSFGAAALLLLQPRGMYVLERGWSEPLVVLLLAATVFCAVRAPRVMPWMLGLFLASKQYVPFGIGAILLLVHSPITLRSAGTMLGKAAVAALVVTLPFVLWHPAAFWNSAVLLQFQQPFRWDALSFLAWWMDGERHPPRAVLLIPLVALATATMAVLLRGRRTPAGFAAGLAVVFFAFFAFNKQAFANYYYFVIGAMCCAIATATASAED
jgi:hypothetical protein